MKKIVLSLFVLAPIAVWAQPNTFTITGKFKNVAVSGPYVYLLYTTEGKNRVDSAKVTNDEYVLKGALTGPGPATLFNVSPLLPVIRSSKDHAAIFLEPASFDVIHIDSFSNVTVSGSTANTEYAKLKKQIDPLMTRGQALSREYREAGSKGDTANTAKLEKELEGLDSEMKEEVLMPYARNNPASPIALFALENAVPADMNPDSVHPVFDRLSESNRKSAEGEAFLKKIEVAGRTSIGQAAPDFTQNDTLGRPVSLSSFRGNYVLIDFWASWCGPCRLENPNVAAAFSKFKSKGFRVIGVSLDQPGAKDKWMAAIHKDGLAWTQLSDLRFWNNEVALAYGIGSIPQNFLLDPGGKIIAKGLRGEELEKKLEEVYK